jgi:GNAT superfamily N-acetyltransferase
MIDMDVFVRRAKKKDLRSVLGLYRQLHPDDLPPPAEGVLRGIWSRIRRRRGLYCFVAESAGKVVATGVLAVIPNLTRGGRPYGLIENVVADESCRRRGVGTELLRRILQEAERRGCYKLMVLTDMYREGVIEFYRAAGFQTGVKNGLVALAPFKFQASNSRS